MNPIETTKVAVKTDYKHPLPFDSLRSYLIIAKVFAYVDRKEFVAEIFRSLCHEGRVYIITQNFLPGFLKIKHTSVLSWLYEVVSKGKTLEFAH